MDTPLIVWIVAIPTVALMVAYSIIFGFAWSAKRRMASCAVTPSQRYGVRHPLRD